jgi:alkaline phosphatase
VEIARERGRATGIVSNASITDATAAAFYAETSDPLDYPVIARQLAESQGVDVIMGGGAADFVSDGQGGRRNDARDLIQEMRDKGYDVVRSELELEGTPSWRSPKTLGLFSMGNLNFADEFAAEAGQPTLSTMVRNAIRLLQYYARGNVLIVDAGLAGKSAVQNEGERTLREILALDEAVAEAVRYAETALEFELAASRGSDFHSPDESRIDLGTLPYLPGQLTPVWELLTDRIQ